MSGTMEPSAAVPVRALSRLFQSPWNWAKTNIRRAGCLYLSVQAHIHPFDAWYRFQISSAAARFCSNRCNACKENSWCIFNGFIFHFCVPAFFFLAWKAAWGSESSLPAKSLFQGWQLCFWCISGLFPSLKASGSVPEILWTGMMRHTAQGWDFVLTDETGVGDAWWWERRGWK